MFVAIISLLSGSILFSSCIGSFSLTRKLFSWNQSIGDKFVNELIFVALLIVPVYEIACLADLLVINSIEFWTDENPVSDADVKIIEGEKGIYKIERNPTGYHIEQEGSDDIVDFIFDQKNKTWSIDMNGDITTLLKVIDESEVLMYLPDGSTMNVPLNEAGVLAFREVVEQKAYFAAK